MANKRQENSKTPSVGENTSRWNNSISAHVPSLKQIDGFEAWAPELAILNTGEFFDPAKFQEVAALERANFWFQARNELILWALKRYCTEPRRYAEIGCGTGFVLSAVEKAFPETEMLGTELFTEGLKFAATRCGRTKLVQVDARQIPYRDQFDVVGIFDVLEHIQEDREVLEQIGKSLIQGGHLIITVPQHMWLWSPVDVAACHVRRYTARELEDKVVDAGFEVLRSTSFVSLLLPAMLAARATSHKPAVDTEAELKINKHLNWVLRQAMAIELTVIRLGINFGLGGSRLLVARKKNVDSI